MAVSRREFIKLLGATAAVSQLGDTTTTTATAQTKRVIGDGDVIIKPPWAPDPPPYPYYIGNSRNVVIQEANRISTTLENYVREWFEGRAAAQLPDSLIPSGIDRNGFRNFRLVRAEDIRAERQWAVREAEELNLAGLRGGFPDPHCTYLVNPAFFAPFGSRLVIEGEFPRARFFDIQVTPSFHPESYRWDANGVGEVPIVDADIEPLPGHTNPFRAGANRLTKRRCYRVEYDLAIGNPAELNQAFRPPYYRAPGNRRVGGALMYQGAGGEPNFRPLVTGRGFWQLGEIWLRYYAPDRAQGVFGGVPLPRYYYELSNGRRFFIECDWTNWLRPLNLRKPPPGTLPGDPPPETATRGWDSQVGIYRTIFGGIATAYGANAAYVRAVDKGVTGRGENEPAPNNFEPCATTCTYINYLTRPMNLGWFKVIVITGKLPTTPRTREGEARMTAAQARYWSLTSYTQNLPDSDGWGGAAITSVMDDELVLDEQRRYILAYSWDGWLYRPSNSRPENGVTWRDWSLHTTHGLTVRWLSVNPDWSFPLAPNESNLGWRAHWASRDYDRNLIGYNNRNGFLQDYLPRVHYMTKAQFEALGSGRINPNQIPVW